MCLALTYLYGHFEDPLFTATRRYFHWAADNELPLVYALKILGQSQSPVWADWNVYERPPLATAFVLLLSPFTEGRLGYQSLGILLQGSSLLGVWTFLVSFSIPPFARRVALAMVAFSVFAIANTVFVWPKLLCVTFLFLAAGGYAVERGQRRWHDYIPLGISAGLAMLSHGGSFFALVAMALVIFALEFRTGHLKKFATQWAVASMLGSVLLLPWLIYAGSQGKPTDKLIKWHIGGSLPNPVVDAKSSVEVIWEGYGALSLSDIISNKWTNLKSQFLPMPGVLSYLGDDPPQTRKRLADLICTSLFYVLIVPCLFVALAFVAGRRVIHGALEWDAVPLSLWLGLSGIIVWCLLMFGPKMAVTDPAGSSAAATLFQGTYFPVVALLVCLALVVARATRTGAMLMVLAQFQLFVYVGWGDAYRMAPSGTLAESGPPDMGMLIAAIGSAFGLAVALAVMNPSEDAGRTAITEADARCAE